MKKFYLFFVILFGVIFASCSTMIEDFGKVDNEEPESSKCRIEYYFESLIDSDYELNSELTVFDDRDKVDTNSISQFEGFSYEFSDSKLEDSIYIVKRYYKRNEVTLSFNTNGGYWADEGDNKAKVFKGKFGQAIDSKWYEVELKRDDYEFKGWDVMYKTFPAEDCESNAIWDQTYARYTVIQKLENLDGTYSATKYQLGGKPGDMTNVNPEEIDGFELLGFTNKTIAADGSTEIEITYNRKLLTITFKLAEEDSVKTECKWNSKTWEDSDKSEDYVAQVKYGSSIPDEIKNYVDKPVRGKNVSDDESANWQFAGWNSEYNLPETVKTNSTFVAQWAKPASTYIVRSKFEKPGFPGEIDESLTVEEKRVGQVGNTTSVVPAKIPGYIADEVEQQVIDSINNSTIVEVVYRLTQVTVSFNPNGGLWQDGSNNGESNIITATGYYGEQIPRYFGKAPVKELNEFKGWRVVYSDDSEPELLSSFSYTFGTCNTSYTAQWEITGAYVKIRFWQESLSGEYDAGYAAGTGYNEELTQLFVSDSGKETEIVPDISDSKYNGYEIFDIEQTIIPDEPDTSIDYIIKVKLARKLIQYTFAPDGGTWQNSWVDHGTAPAVKTGKYGSSLVTPAANDLFRADYKFVGWKNEDNEETVPPTVFGYENKKFTANWQETGTKYTVQCWFEKLDQTDYEQNLTVWPDLEETGYSLDKLTVSPPVIEGFDFVSYDGLLEGDFIKPDGSTVLKLYYNRKEIKYVFNANGGKFSSGKTLFEVSGLYGSQVDISSLSDPIKEGFDRFKGWDKSIPAAFGSDNITFNAEWIEVPVTIIAGVGTYTNKDIEMDAVVQGTTVTVTVIVPYDGSWLFDLRDNNTSISESKLNKTVNGNEVTFTFELPAGSGRHKLEVYAKESGTNSVKSKFKTVDVE